jgi:hypothetical protein
VKRRQKEAAEIFNTVATTQEIFEKLWMNL